MSSVRGKKQHLILTEKRCLSAQRGGGKVKSSMRKLFYSVCCVLAPCIFLFLSLRSAKKTISCIHSLTSIDVIAFAIQASICVDLGSLSFIASNGKKSTQWLHTQTQWGIKRTMTAHSLSSPTIPSAKIEPHMIDSHVFQSIFYASLICVCADFENCVSSSILFPCNQLHAFSLQFFFVSIKNV